MNRLFILCLFMVSLQWAKAQSCGLAQNIPIRIDATDTVELEVFDLVNNDLSNPGQGVCSVYLDFIHSVVGDFEVWLESPAGQQVQLIGPNASTPVRGVAFEYLVTFLAERLNTPPSNQQWDNDLPNPVAAGVTEGDFFPYQGRLDDFDTGPVNGTWLLIMTTSTESIAVGGNTLRDVKITFCDPLGENCCLAEAGQFSRDSILQVCLGSPVLDTLPVIDFGGSRPDTLAYGYTWLLTSDSLIIAQDSLANWEHIAVGTYTMYGLSYARPDSSLLPVAENMLHIDTLRNQLGLPLPPFCGDLTENAWIIQVLPGSDTTFLQQVLCAGDSLRIADTTLFDSGHYTFDLSNQLSCDSTVVVDLEVVPLYHDVIDTVICAGSSVMLGSQVYTAPGTYVDTLQSREGCDSITILNLVVADGEPSRDTVRQLVCSGQTITVGGQNFDSSGVYEVVLTNAAGCDSTIVLDLTVLRPEAIVASGEQTLTCRRPSLLLDGSGSEPGPGILTYRWERQREGMLAVDIVGSTPQLTVDRGGRYFLQVQLQQDSVLCSNRTTAIVVTVDTLPPLVEAGSDQVIDCNQPTAILGSPLIVDDSMTAISWSIEAGIFTGDTSAPRPIVDQAGLYTMTVTNAQNGCTATDSVRVRADTTAPNFTLQVNGPLSCRQSVAELSTTDGSDQGSPFAYAWEGPCILSPTDTSRIQVDCASTYRLTMTNTVNGCRTLDSIVVVQDTINPVAAVVSESVPLDCSSGEAVLDASPSQNGAIAWWQNNTLLATGPQLVATDAGEYQVIVTNTTLDCADTISVEVTLDCKPVASISAPEPLTCTRPRIILDAGSSADGNPLSYEWTGPDAACLSTATGPQVEVRCAGRYQVIITNTAVGQSDTAVVEVIDRTAAPVAEAGDDQTLTCANPEATLSANGSSAGLDIQYTWITDRGDTIGMGPEVTVMEAGSYVLSVVHTATGCTAEDVVQINRDADVPDIRFGSPLLPCTQDTFRLEALVVPPGTDYRYQWSGPGITGNTDSAFVQVDAIGTYRLEVVDTLTGCRVVESIVVEDQACGPCLQPLLADTLSCYQPEVRLEVAFCEDCTGCSYRWSTSDGQIITDPTQPFLVVDAPGTYRVVVTDAQGLAEAQSVTVVADKRLPDIPGQPDTVLTCNQPVLMLGQTLPAPGDSLTYSWRNDVGEILDSSNLPLLEIDSGGLYLLRITNTETGCTLLDSVAVAVDQASPVITAGSNDTLDCTNPILRLEGQIFSEERTIRYQWTTTGGIIRGGATTLNPLVEGPGVYVFTAQDTLTGCLASDDIELIPPQNFPELSPLSTFFLGCSQNEVGVQAPITPSADLRYEWRDTAGVIISDQREAFFSLPGEYEVLVEDISSGCSDVGVFSIALDTIAPKSMLPDQVVLGCTDLSAELSPELPQNGPYTFRWTSAAGMNLSGITTPVLRVSRADSFFLTVRDTINNCVVVDTSVVSVTRDRPQVGLPVSYALTCDAPQQALMATLEGSPNGYTFQWSTTDGQLIVPTNGLSTMVSVPGEYRLLTTDTTTGCQAEVFTTVTLQKGLPRPVVDTVGQLPLTCRQASVVLDAGSSQTASGNLPQLSWQVISGNPPAGNLTDPRLTITDPVTLQLIGVDPDNGCRDSTTVIITADRTAPSTPVLSTPDTLTCALSSTQVEVVNYDANILSVWRQDGDTLATNVPFLTITQPGQYDLMVVEEANGCRAEATVVVAQETSRPELAIAGEGTLGCNGSGSVQLRVEDARSGILNNIAWEGPDGGILGTNGEREIRAVLPGLYTVAAGYAESDCRDTTSFSVRSEAAGIDSIAVVVQEIGCGAEARGSIRIEAVFGGQGPFLYAFSADGPLTANKQVTNLSPGAYEVRVEDANGCSWIQSVLLAPGSDLAIDLGPDVDIVSGDSIELVPSLTGMFKDFTWLAQDRVVGETGRLRVAPAFTVSYRLLGTGANGCIVDDVITVFVREELPVYLPSVFAPDSKQKVNRIFFVQAGEQVAEIEHFDIFNRWGEQVFTRKAFAPNDPQYGWDGQFRGQELKAGVYVYQVVVRLRNGERRMLKGDITLLR